jgi:hypothetical protein
MLLRQSADAALLRHHMRMPSGSCYLSSCYFESILDHPIHPIQTSNSQSSRFKCCQLSEGSNSSWLHLSAAACCTPDVISGQMLKLKAAGDPKWYHPSSLTSGGRFANRCSPVKQHMACSPLPGTSTQEGGLQSASECTGTIPVCLGPMLAHPSGCWAWRVSCSCFKLHLALGSAW